MADFTITISNAVRTFGPAPSDKWAEYNWNAFLWGEGTNGLSTRTLKLISESVTTDTTVSKSQQHVISNSISPTADMGSETLYDTNGYYHVYPNDTTELEDRDYPTWAQGSGGVTTWTRQAASSTTWSAA